MAANNLQDAARKAERSAGFAFVNQRELHPKLAAANAAFARIKSHRKLFHRDWLPFADGVYFVSLAAWETAGRRRRLDGRPDWADYRVQVTFRRAIEGLPWAGYFEIRRPLLSALRHIGDERERFLHWYDALPEVGRERTGYPETLWRVFAKKVLSTVPAEHDGEKDDKAATARSDADRMTQLISLNERLLHFCARLGESLKAGRSVLEAGLDDELNALLDAEEASS